MSEKKLTKVYTPSGQELMVNEYMVGLIKLNDKSLDGYTLEKPKAKAK